MRGLLDMAARTRAVAAACVLATALTSCATRPPTISTEIVRIEIMPDLNDDNPVAVDMVYVTDEKLMARLADTTARQWFQNRQQFQRDFPQGFVLRQWEFVPGALIVAETVPAEARNALAMFVFADYFGAGDHRARLDRHRQPVLTFGARGFSVRAE